MSDNYWMTPEQREDWNRGREETEQRRAEVEPPERWSDATHDEFSDIVDEVRRKSKTGERMTRAEKQALKEMLKNPDKWLSDVKANIANRREDATPDVRFDPDTGLYYDRFGRECDSHGF